MRTMMVGGLLVGAVMMAGAALAQTAGPTVSQGTASGPASPAAPALVPTLPEPVKAPVTMAEPPKTGSAQLESAKAEAPKVDAPHVDLPKQGLGTTGIPKARVAKARVAGHHRGVKMTSAGGQKGHTVAAVHKSGARGGVKKAAAGSKMGKQVVKASERQGRAKHVTTVKHRRDAGHTVVARAARHGKQAAPARTSVPTTEPMLPKI